MLKPKLENNQKPNILILIEEVNKAQITIF